MRDPLAQVWLGRDLMYQNGWHFVFRLLPMRSLMNKRSDQGRMILCGLEIEVGIRVPLDRFVDAQGWFVRPYIKIHSDASEIAERRLELSYV